MEYIYIIRMCNDTVYVCIYIYMVIIYHLMYVYDPLHSCITYLYIVIIYSFILLDCHQEDLGFGFWIDFDFD